MCTDYKNTDNENWAGCFILHVKVEFLCCKCLENKARQTIWLLLTGLIVFWLILNFVVEEESVKTWLWKLVCYSWTFLCLKFDDEALWLWLVRIYGAVITTFTRSHGLPVLSVYSRAGFFWGSMNKQLHIFQYKGFQLDKNVNTGHINTSSLAF